jgi:hypothetical protein
MADEIESAGASGGETEQQAQTGASAEAGTATTTTGEGAGPERRGDGETRERGEPETRGAGGAEDAGKPEKAAKPEYPDLRESLRAATRERSEAKGRASDLQAELDRVKAENERLRATTAQAPQAGATQREGYLDGGLVNPELAGLAYDPGDKTFEIEPGQWRTQREALALVRQERAYEAGRQSESERRAAATRERAELIGNAMLKEIHRAADTIAVPEASRDVPRQIYANAVAGKLVAAGIDLTDPDSLPDDFEDRFGRMMAEAEIEVKGQIAAIQGAQAQANAAAAATAPLKPSGVAGATAPAGLKDMKPEQKAGYLTGLAKRVFAKHGIGDE